MTDLRTGTRWVRWATGAALAVGLAALWSCAAGGGGGVGLHAPDLPSRTLTLTWSGDPARSIDAFWLDRGDIEAAPKAVTLIEPDGTRRSADADHQSFAGIQAGGAGPRLQVRRVRFKGLRPDTRYALRLAGSPPVVFDTAPATLDRPLVFAEGGDCGTSRFVAQLHRHVARRKPLFGVVGGDIAYADGSDEAAWVTFLSDWRAHLREADAAVVEGVPADRLVPLIVTIGNHELPQGFSGTREDAPLFLALFGDPTGGLFAAESYGVLDFGDYLSLLLLDSGHISPPDGPQTRWLEAKLRERVDRPHVFSVHHVPMFPSHRAPGPWGPRGAVGQAMREHWLPLFATYGVSVAFEHDDHTYKRSLPLVEGEVARTPAERSRATVFLGDGAWGRGGRWAHRREHLARAAGVRHVFAVTLEPGGGRSFEAIDPGGEVFDTFRVDPPEAPASEASGASESPWLENLYGRGVGVR